MYRRREGRRGRPWFRRARSALRIADDPAHGVAGGDGTGADELLARLNTLAEAPLIKRVYFTEFVVQ